MDETHGHFDHLLDRTQKITEALYRVTDFFSDTEPLKWVLRKEAVEIFNFVLKISVSSSSDSKHRALESISNRIWTLMRILEIASSNSFVSETNFSVLKREYTTIMDILVSSKDNFLLESVTLSDYQTKKTSVSHVKDTKRGAPAVSVGGDVKNGTEGVKSDVGNEKSELFQPAGPPGGERRERILSFIKGQNWVSVGDLAAVFQGKISGKTIQRDLIGMANEGLLLKEGDKRWRRYRASSSEN